MLNRNAVIRSIETVIARLGTVTLLAVLFLGAAQAQPPATTTSTAGWTPLGEQPGAPAGSYALSGFDNVNLFNGHMNFRLPLMHVGGRGSAGYTMMLPIEQHWRVQTVAVPHCDQTGCTYYESDYKYIANPNWWTGIMPGYGPGVLQGRQSGDDAVPVGGCADGVYTHTLTRLTFTAPDGTEYELRDQQTGGQPLAGGSGCFQGISRGKIFITADGTAATFVSDSDIYDTRQPTSNNLIFPSGYLLMKDGTRYRIDGGQVTWIRDTNGNLTYNGQDSLNRHVDVTYGGGFTPDVIAFKGANGATRTITVRRAMLDTVLRKHPDGSTEYSIRTFASLFPTLQNVQNGNFDIIVVSSVELPDGRQYQFRYDSYGNLAQVILPTGGRLEYDWTVGTYQFGDHVKGIYERVVERRTAVDTTTSAFASRMTYAVDGNIITADNVDPNNGNALLARSKHYFYGSPLPNLNAKATDYSIWTDGREYQTEEYATDGTTVLRRVNNTWQQRAPVSWWTASADSAPPNDPRLVESTTTLVDTNQVTKHSAINPNDGSIGFDQYNNQTDTWEYDYGNGTPGSLVRHTHTNFLTSGYDTLNPSLSSPDMSLTYHIRSLPTQESVYDANNNEKERTTHEYDNYANDSFHASLVDRSNISGHDSGFTTSFTYRGNSTATSKYLLPAGTAITSYSQYDIAGNPVKSIDPRSTTSNIIATIIAYDDNFGGPDGSLSDRSSPSELGTQQTFAFPTQATNALGQSGYTQYDYYLGRAVDQQDFNSIIGTEYFNDLLDRPTQLIRANNQSTLYRSQTMFSYDDANHTITTTNDLTAFNDNALMGQTLYDGLGRTTETRKYESSGSYITTKQFYDAMGRAQFATNPYRASAATTDGWTRTSYDALGRAVEAATFSGSIGNQPPPSGTSSNWTGSVTATYSGNAVTVTDQANKARRSITDALGRLARVDEPDANNNLGTVVAPTQPTSYTYDLLDDLITISQGGQTRTFDYDSVKRLTLAVTPESGTVSYTYYNDGNISTKTDGRSITTAMSYDNLGRVKTRTYSDGTPSVFYYYDNQALPTGAPSYAAGASTGNLLAVTYGTNGTATAGTYYGYDPAGRLVFSQQRTDGVDYTFAYDYNLAGKETSETYPSGRVIKTDHDSAGRNVHIYNDPNNGGVRDYAGTSSALIQYAASGALQIQTLGNGLIHQISFNSRLQPVTIQLGTTANSQSILRLDYFYGVANNITDPDTSIDASKNNGNLARVNYTIGSAMQNAQTFQYDNLNRLLNATEAQGGYSGTALWQQVFGYDRYGNRSVIGSTTGLGTFYPSPTIDQSTNRFVIGNGFSYDAAGNLTSEPTASGSTTDRTYAYDAENHLSSLNGGATTYSYDGEGKRVKKVTGSITSIFVYDSAGLLVAEYDGSNSAEFNGAVPKTFVQTNQTNWPIQKVSYVTADHLGSPRIWTSSDGTVVPNGRHDYAPFGEELFAGIGGRTTNQGYESLPQADGQRKQFTSKERDTETGLDYFEARYDSSSQGRFTSADSLVGSLTNPQSLNLYAYVQNNPLNLIDPTGHFADDFGDDDLIHRSKALDELKHNEAQDNNHFAQGWKPVKGKDKHGKPTIRYKWETKKGYKTELKPQNAGWFPYVDSRGRVIVLHWNPNAAPGDQYHELLVMNPSRDHTSLINTGNGLTPVGHFLYGDIVADLGVAGYHEHWDGMPEHRGEMNFWRDTGTTINIGLMTGTCTMGFCSTGGPSNSDPVIETRAHYELFNPSSDRMNHARKEVLPHEWDRIKKAMCPWCH